MGRQGSILNLNRLHGLKTAGPVSVRSLRGSVLTLLVVGLMALCDGRAQSGPDELIISGFNGTGFDTVSGTFTQMIGPTAVTLSSNDALNAAEIVTGGWDLRPLLDHVLHVRVRPNAGHEAEFFDLTLIDSANNEAGWDFSVPSLTTVASFAELQAKSTLRHPNWGTGDWQHIDMSDIQRVRLLGRGRRPKGFDLSFDEIKVAPPRRYYDGQAAAASWRLEAAARIEAIRKADLRVRVSDELGQPVSGARIAVRMQQHAFGFGSAVQAWRLLDDDPQNELYRQHMTRLFNRSTIEGSLQWLAWEGYWGEVFEPEVAQAALVWLSDNDLMTRGHVMVWPGHRWVPPHVQELIVNPPSTTDEQQALRDVVNAHIADIGTAAAGRVFAWDVINEVRAQDDLLDVLDIGDLAMVEWFEQARQADPNAQLFLNEYGIIACGGNVDTSAQQLHEETLQFLLSQGAPIGGIGIQAHFTLQDLTGPVVLWQLWDRFAQLGLPIHITEFDVNLIDELLQADYTRDFLTAAFAHEAIDTLMLWGFWESAQWRPDAALFRGDWSLKPNGQAYIDLVFEDWWTQVDLISDQTGTAAVRGFKGDYEILVEAGGVSQVVAGVLGDTGLSVHVHLSRSAGLEVLEMEL